MSHSSDGARLLAAAQWTDDNNQLSNGSPGHYLKEFAYKHKMPRLVRIVKGHYMSLGGSITGGGAGGQTMLLVSLGKRKRLLAQCVKFKETSRKVSAVGHKISVPAGFDGFFEILSEDGRSVRCIESVAELCKRFPDSVLVRENVRAYVSKSDDVDAITRYG